MSMYTTAQLLAANEKKFKFDPLFLRLFFRESYPFTTEKVYLSQIPGLVNMALYVSPIVSGEVIRSRGGSTSEFTPGYVKPKHEVNPQMTLRRLPDEDPQNLADPAYRRRRIIMQNMRDEELAIAQVEEMQAVSAVLKGKYTMTTQRKAWDVLSDFCSAMRCMPVWNGQTLTFVQDRPSDSGPSSPHLPLVQEMTSQPLLTEGRRQPGFSVAPVAWEYPEQISFRWSDAQIP